MAKNKKKKNQGGGQQFLSPERYLKERARLQPIGKCYINADADEAGMAQIIVTRTHTGGRISMAVFLVDMLCLGVKDTYYRLRMDEEELEEIMDRQPLEWNECSYEEAHNRIYGAIAFAEEAGIEPHKDFRLTQYMLEEDNDDIPHIKYDFGKDGKHLLICHSNLEASRYLPTLHKHLGDDFEYIIADRDEDPFDENYDEDDEFTPIFIKDCIADIDSNQLMGMAFGLGIEIDPAASIEMQRKQYIKGILEDPTETLMRLPNEDLAMLEELADQADEDRIVWYPANSLDPLMFHYGLIEYDDEEPDGTYYQVTEDFWKAVRPHLKEVEKEEANQARLSVEGIITGAVNLYGCISLKEAKHLLVEMMGMSQEAAEELFDMVLGHSALLPFLLHPMIEDTEAIKASYDTNMTFTSRFGWDSTLDLVKSIAQRDDKIPARRAFTMKEIIMAGATIPVIPNEQQKDFTHFLCSRLGYDKDSAQLICHNLWLRAQHEEDPDNPHGTYLDYFTKKVIAEAKKKPQLSVINEGMKALQAYMNAMPRWMLKGHTPKEIGS
ncbi:MAG: hypothetical protein IJQ38_05210 [Bacteroidaceae bacterium]|nr:hypothetical protein [Bacteroidaceae bacterium]